MKICKSCKNENIIENQLFCHVCGEEQEINKEQVVEILKKLLEQNPALYRYERQAINYAIKELEVVRWKGSIGGAHLLL